MHPVHSVHSVRSVVWPSLSESEKISLTAAAVRCRSYCAGSRESQIRYVVMPRGGNPEPSLRCCVLYGLFRAFRCRMSPSARSVACPAEEDLELGTSPLDSLDTDSSQDLSSAESDDVSLPEPWAVVVDTPDSLRRRGAADMTE